MHRKTELPTPMHKKKRTEEGSLYNLVIVDVLWSDDTTECVIKYDEYAYVSFR